MSDSGAQLDHAKGTLGAVIEVLDEIDRGLATAQRDEVVAERVGAAALMVGAMALGGVVLLAAAVFLVRKWLLSGGRPERSEQPDVSPAPEPAPEPAVAVQEQEGPDAPSAGQGP